MTMQRFAATLAVFALCAAPLGASAKKTAGANGMPSCKSGDPVVWVNTKSMVYHVQGDTYFGKTKAGKYACQSDAVSMGAHASGAKAGANGSMSGATDSTTPLRHGKKPRPEPTATP